MNEKLGMGWLPDLPDYRDYSPEHEEIKPMLQGATCFLLCLCPKLSSYKIL